MSSFLSTIINGIAPGVESGLSKGLQYEVDWIVLDLKAQQTGDQALKDAVKAIKVKWLSECADAANKVKNSVVNGIIDNKDPFSGSRKMIQDLLVKYPV